MPACQTNGAVAYGEGVWFWHPWLVSSWRRFAGPNRASGNRQFVSDGGKRNSSPGRARYKPSNHCQGRPDAPADTCMLVCVFLALIAHETAGASSTRPSLRPLIFGGLENSSTTRAQRAAGSRNHVHPRHCERSEAIHCHRSKIEWIASSLRSSQ